MHHISQIRVWLRTARKAVLFGVYGSVGCLLGSIVGEGMLAAMGTMSPPQSRVPAQAVCLLVDCSGSMDHDKLREVKSAALAFIDRQAGLPTLVSVVGFGSRTQIESSLTQDLSAARAAVMRLADGGGTRMDAGLDAAAHVLAAPGDYQRNILLFTDGMPDSQGDALRASQKCRASKIRLVAIGTDDAKREYLAKLTGDQRLVFETRSGNFQGAFKLAERAIYSQQMIGGKSENSPWLSLISVGIWTAIIGMGMTLALLVGQNRYLHRRSLVLKDGLIGATVGLVAGLLSGTVSQAFFTAVFATAPGLIGIGRVIAWTLLGALLGLAMSFYVCNLKRRRAVCGGALGGMLGAVAFAVAVSGIGEWSGRLVGAAILGLLVGLMVVLAEVLARDAWVVVKWPGGEESAVSLGAKPIVLGSSDEADIYLRRDQGFPSVAATLTLTGGKVHFEDRTKNSCHTLQDGNKLVVGGLTIEVHAK